MGKNLYKEYRIIYYITMSKEESYKCNNCGLNKPLNELDIWNIKNIITYECADRKKCHKDKLENQIKNIENEDKSKEILQKNYNINFSELEEINYRFRDGSIHYINKNNKKIYSWNKIKKQWYIPNENVINQINKLLEQD